jgi:hypothetical protein
MLILVVAVSVLVLLFSYAQPEPRQISTWQAAPMITKADQPGNAPLPVIPALIGTANADSQLDLRVDDGLYVEQRQQLSGESQQALQYVIQRTNLSPNSVIIAVLKQDPGCGIHGLADTSNRVVYAYSCESIARNRPVNILAHEFVHQLAHDRYGNAHLNSDLILLEGLATWGAGQYWLGGLPDFRSYVRKQREAGIRIALATHYSGLGIAGMNALYYQWGSFVEFLLERYSREQFDRLYVSGNSTPGSADYAAIYGRDLPTLEREWEAWVDQAP